MAKNYDEKSPSIVADVSPSVQPSKSGSPLRANPFCLNKDFAENSNMTEQKKSSVKPQDLEAVQSKMKLL